MIHPLSGNHSEAELLRIESTKSSCWKAGERGETLKRTSPVPASLKTQRCRDSTSWDQIQQSMEGAGFVSSGNQSRNRDSSVTGATGKVRTQSAVPSKSQGRLLEAMSDITG